MTDSSFTANSANAGGGLGRFNAQLRISNSSITQNTASVGGGGLHVDGGPQPGLGGCVEVHDTTLSGNTSTSGQGGGVYNHDQLNLVNVTIKDNTNGLFNSGSTRLQNTVLQNPGSLNCDGAPSSSGYNFSTDNSCNFTFPNDHQGIGLDPKLGPLTVDSFNITFYHMPQAGSPLINAALGCSPRDQRHVLRPDACDSGAVEYGGLLPRVYVPWMVK